MLHDWCKIKKVWAIDLSSEKFWAFMQEGKRWNHSERSESRARTVFYCRKRKRKGKIRLRKQKDTFFGHWVSWTEDEKLCKFLAKKTSPVSKKNISNIVRGLTNTMFHIDRLDKDLNKNKNWRCSMTFGVYEIVKEISVLYHKIERQLDHEFCIPPRKGIHKTEV